MLIETKAIVLHRTAYSDHHHIVHLYTESYGRLGVLIPARPGRRHRERHLLLPLSEIELVGDLKLGKGLAHLRELRLCRVNQQIQTLPVKRSQGIFLAELLYRVLRHDEADPALYGFIAESLGVLDVVARGVANFYLAFCHQLLHYLAIAPTLPRRTTSPGEWFDLREVQLTYSPVQQHEAVPPALLPAMRRFMQMTYGNMHAYRYNRDDRRIILDYLLLYYRLHLPSFGAIKSLEILRATSNP